MEVCKIGLIGFGTVGSGVYNLLKKNSSLITERTSITFEIKTICDLDTDNIKKSCDDIEITDNWKDITNDPEIDIVIELIGGTEPAKTIILDAFDKGKSVVTANKKLLAEDGLDIFRKASDKNLSIGFEAAVGGGIPCILGLKTGLVGNRIRLIMGILNGTTNYILTRMSFEGLPFDRVLKDAQENGFAEADPTFDIEGFDAGHKISLLSMIAFNKNIDFRSIPIEGITKINQVDISYARDMGYVIKLLGIAKMENSGLDISVRPTMIPEDHPLAQIHYENNAVLIDGNMTDPVLFYGKGAGSYPTASAVISDIVQIAESHGARKRFIPASEDVKFIPADERRSRYYLRIHTEDTPGILAKITGIIGKYNISIASILQREMDDGYIIPLILMTHEAEEKGMLKAVKEIEEFDFVYGEVMLIRVEDPLD